MSNEIAHLPEELRLAIEHEREECARIADQVCRARQVAGDEEGAGTARQVARFIRERG